MKLRYTVILLTLAAPAFIASQNGVAEDQNQDRTGAPGSSQPCSQCHSAGAFNPSLSIQLRSLPDLTPVTEYVAGEMYTVSFTITAGTGTPATYGFQATAVFDSDASNAGVFSDPGPSVQLEDVNGRHIVEHSNDSPSNMFIVNWTAPAEGSGPLTFYASGVASNNSMSILGDGFSDASLAITEQEEVTSSPELLAVRELNWRIDGGLIRVEAPEAGSINVYGIDGRLIEALENIIPGEPVWLNPGNERIVVLHMVGNTEMYSAKVALF